MYLVAFPIPYTNTSQLVFCMTDPRRDGFIGPVQEDTELESPNLCDSSWLTALKERVVGQDPDLPYRYRLFQSASECRQEGFHLVGPMPVVAYRWSNDFFNLPRRAQYEVA